jgi:hypothetical protein
VLENGGHGKYSIFSNVCVPMLQTGSGGGEKRFDELGFTKLAQEAQGVASDVFVRVL